MSTLTKWIEQNLVMTSWGDYEGVSEPGLAQLGALKVLVEQAIQQKIREERDQS